MLIKHFGGGKSKWFWAGHARYMYSLPEWQAARMASCKTDFLWTLIPINHRIIESLALTKLLPIHSLS